MIAKKYWCALVAVLGVVPAMGLAIFHGFVPGLSDVADPLGRPASLSLDLIESADTMDELTAELVPKHTTLAGDVQVLHPLADNLAELSSSAGELTTQASSLNASTAHLAAIGAPLPGLISDLTTLADQARPTVFDLSGAVGSVGQQLGAIERGLGTISGTLSALGPKAATISSTLAVIEEEARHVQEFGPLLAVLGPAVNGPLAPADPSTASTPTP